MSKSAFALALLLAVNLASPALAVDKTKKHPQPTPSAEPADSCEAPCPPDDDFPVDLNLLFDVGYSQYNLSALNQVMTAKGYNAFSEHNLALGAGTQLILWHVITEFETHFAFNAPVLNDDYVANLGLGHFLLNVGYQFRPIPQLSLYPLVGIGLGFLDLNFRRRAQLPSFDEFLANPGRQGRISDLFLALNAGLGLDWISDWGFQIGLRGGYLWTPPSNWWQIQDVGNSDNSVTTPVAGGPDISLSGPYFKLMLGF